ncbi:MAG: phosphatidate cytidylyltransferase [Planctomyces sp.]
MLGWRIAVSVVLIPALISIFWLDATQGRSAFPLLAFCAIVGLRSTWEMTSLLRTRNMSPSTGLCAAGSLVVVASGWLHQLGSGASVLTSLGWICSAITLVFCVMLVHYAAAFHEPGNTMEALGASLVSIVYGAMLLTVTAQFRWFPDERIGYFAIGSMIIAVKSGDIGAYTFGRLWGKRKMVPRLSPGKTGMGFVGAIVGSVLGGTLWICFGGSLFDAKPVAASLLIVVSYSAFMGLVGLTGDLCESLIKRDVGSKDSASLMPGFGGLLDLLDSPLFAGPFALAWWHFLPPAIVPG